MSIAPPGYPTDETDPGSGDRQADDNVQYEFKSVQALRGRASSAKAKWQDQGWELVSENRGALRTELNFRRVKPKTFGDYLLSFAAAFRRLQPKRQLALAASCALILVAGIVGIVAGSQGGGETPSPGAAQTTASTAPPAEPTAAPTTTPTPAPTPSAAQRRRATRLRKEAAARERVRERAERRAKARARARVRARARARAERREQALQQERRRNTAQLQSGVTCAEIGDTDIPVEPGVDIDGDGDGIGCES
jgi:hypothetical protein